MAKGGVTSEGMIQGGMAKGGMTREGGMLLDAGEGTWQQLLRLFAASSEGSEEKWGREEDEESERSVEQLEVLILSPPPPYPLPPPPPLHPPNTDSFKDTTHSVYTWIQSNILSFLFPYYSLLSPLLSIFSIFLFSIPYPLFLLPSFPLSLGTGLSGYLCYLDLSSPRRSPPRPHSHPQSAHETLCRGGMHELLFRLSPSLSSLFFPTFLISFFSSYSSLSSTHPLLFQPSPASQPIVLIAPPAVLAFLRDYSLLDLSVAGSYLPISNRLLDETDDCMRV